MLRYIGLYQIRIMFKFHQISEDEVYKNLS